MKVLKLFKTTYFIIIIIFFIIFIFKINKYNICSKDFLNKFITKDSLKKIIPIKYKYLIDLIYKNEKNDYKIITKKQCKIIEKFVSEKYKINIHTSVFLANIIILLSIIFILLVFKYLSPCLYYIFSSLFIVHNLINF